ncbi:hypothetical protein ACNPMX_01405 [Stenotrophomonas maltophilia]
MLFALHIEVAYRLVGMAPAAFFEYATGLSHMNYRRGRGYTAFMAKREKVEADADSLLLRMLQKRGVPGAEFRGFKDDIPQGHSAIMLYGLDLLNEHTSTATRELVARFDASDKLLWYLPDTDVPGFLNEIGPLSQLGPAYCPPLAVADIRDPSLELKLELTEPERTALKLVLNRRANMALSFLAAVDHEIGHSIGRAGVPDAFAGLPRFAVLLAPPAPANRRRHSPADPVARLVHFIGAFGYFSREGSLPERPLSIEEMGAQVDLSGIRLGEGDRFLRSLRSGKAPLSRKAYLGWWERHRHRYPPPVPSTGPLPPAWLIDP